MISKKVKSWVRTRDAASRVEDAVVVSQARHAERLCMFSKRMPVDSDDSTALSLGLTLRETR